MFLFRFLFLLLFVFSLSCPVWADDPVDPPSDPPVEDAPSEGWLHWVTDSVSKSVRNVLTVFIDYVNQKYDYVSGKVKEIVVKTNNRILDFFEFCVEGFRYVFNGIRNFVQRCIDYIYQFCNFCFDFFSGTFSAVLNWFYGIFTWFASAIVGIIDFFQKWFFDFFTWLVESISFLWTLFLDLLRFCWRFILSQFVVFLDWMVKQFFSFWVLLVSFIPDFGFGTSQLSDVGGQGFSLGNNSVVNLALGLGYFISFGLILDDFIPIHEAFYLFALALTFRFSVVVFRFIYWVILEIIP